MNKIMKRLGVAAGIACFCCLGCIEVDPLLQGGRKGSLSSVTNTTYHGCAYSSEPWGREWTAGGDRRHALYSVRAKYNWWYALVATCTFGVYMPMDLEWRYDMGERKGVSK